MKVIDLSVRKVAPEEMADGKPAIGCFVTIESGGQFCATLPIEQIETKGLPGAADALRFFAAAIDNLGK